MTIEQDVPDLDLLLAMAPAELARIVLKRLAHFSGASQRFHTFAELNNLVGTGSIAQSPAYRGRQSDEVSAALQDALGWLMVNQIVAPVLDDPASSGWFRFTRLGRRLASNPDVSDSFRRAQQFPKELLHPLIAEKVWLSLARGDLADAVFTAFRTVEERVRRVGRYGLSDYGSDLMRRAFHPETGPLTRRSDPMAEREGLAALGAGAILSYKNPHSHRTITLTEPLEAQEMVMLASHLLRIVDNREQAVGGATAGS